MAKASSKKSTKKVKRHYPCQRTIQLRDLDTNPGIAGGRLLRGANLLSGANRRLYREARLYNMKLDIEPGTALASAGVSVYVLRDTWDLHGAYKMAMQKFYNAMKEELTAAGARGRWHDFRVLPDFQGPELAGVVNAPSGGSPSMTDSDVFQETDISAVVDQSGAGRTFSLSAQTTTSTQYGIMSEWSFSDRINDDPASASVNLAYDGLDPGQDEANYDAIRTQGNTPPYDTDAPLSQWRRVGTIRETASGVSKLSTGYFEAPLGIVVLISSIFTADKQSYSLHATFQKGDYKGVNAPAYATPVLTEAMEYEVV